jgi:LuxR family maltose regulon positive regulatory protein
MDNSRRPHLTAADARRGSLPRIPEDLLELPRLRARLDQWAPVTVLSGAQGYGKTTLVASWLEQQLAHGHQVVWLTCSAEMDRADVFAARLAEEIDRLGIGAGSEAAARGRADPGSALRRLLDAAPEAERVVLVLDAAQWVRNPQILTRLVTLVHRYRHFHLIICVRGEHPLVNLAGAVVDVVRIAPADLLLTLPEMVKLAEVIGVRPAPGDAERVRNAVGGWIAPVRLVFDAMTAGADGVPLARAEEYVREVVLPAVTDQRTLTELMRFSLVPRLTRRLIRELSEEPDPDRSVAMVEAPGVAEVHYRGEDVELVLPALIRKVLREAFTKRDPRGARAMHVRLAAWYAAQDCNEQMLMAFQHAAAGQDWELLDQIWTDHELTLGMRHPAAVAAVLRSLPEEILDRRPGMRVGLAANAVAASDLDSDAEGWAATIRAYVEASAMITTRQLDDLPLPELLYVGTWQMVGKRMAGRFSEAIEFGDEIERRVELQLAAGAKPAGRRSWFELQRGLTWTLLGEHDEAIRCYQLSWQRGMGAATLIQSNVAANLAMTYALSGDRDRAQRWLQRHDSFDTTGQWGHYVIGVGARVAIGLLALDELDAEACQAQLEHLGDGSTSVELWPYVAYLHAEYGLHEGDAAEALARLNAARRAHPPALTTQGAAATLLGCAAADLLIANGQGQRARHVLERAGDTGDPMTAVPLARISLLAGDVSVARAIAADALHEESTTERVRLELLLLAALAAQRMNDTEDSHRLMRRALELVSRTGVVRPLTTLRPAELGALLRAAGLDLDPGLLELVRQHRNPYPDRIRMVALTRRERQLVEALATGSPRQEIADQMHISINTLKKQLVALYRKLDARTRDEALARLRERGFIQ